jgi:ERCC4-related helicase
VPGRRLLVATSAAEEGIDVQACELVVRYSAAATGIQRVQSRGRGRKPGGKYLTIVLSSTLDMRLHAKSRQEEDMMRTYLRGLGAESAAMDCRAH